MPVTEALSEAEACLVAILLDDSGLDTAEFAWTEPESADGCWRARPYQWSWYRCMDPMQIDQCVAAGQRVCTAGGWVPIEEVVLGDQVLTHRGRWRPVLRAWAQGERDVVRLQGAGVDVVLTADHEVWALRRARAGWTRARDLDEGVRVRLTGRRWVTVSVSPAGTAAVHDLEVDEDHSFVVEGVAVRNCARDVGKSLGIQARAYVFPFAHPGAEMVVTAPELVHLEPIAQAIEQRVFSTRLSREMLPVGRSRLTRRPFRMNFVTGARIVGRIPQVTGRGVKGLHPKKLEMDEASDYPDAGWTELIATLRRGLKGAIWRAHGVTRGIRDRFFEFTQPGPDNPWRVHRLTAMHREDWSDEERQRNIILYGSRASPDYRRNILGLHGDQTNALFVLHRLMKCVDSIEGSEYNTEEYKNIRITAERLEELSGEMADQEQRAATAVQMLDFNDLLARYSIFWVGMDVGFTTDPSEILVAAEYLPSASELRTDRAAHRAVPEKGITRLRIVARIHLERIANPTQADIIRHIIRTVKPQAFGMDATGNGLPLFQDVLATDEDVARVIKGYGFSQTVIVGIDGTVAVDDPEDVLKEAAIKSNVLEFSSDKLRELVDTSRLMLPWDREMLRQWQGQTFSFSKALTGADERRRRRIFSAGSYHTLDAGRMLAMAHAQASIEEIVENLRHPRHEEVLDVFLS